MGVAVSGNCVGSVSCWMLPEGNRFYEREACFRRMMEILYTQDTPNSAAPSPNDMWFWYS